MLPVVAGCLGVWFCVHHVKSVAKLKERLEHLECELTGANEKRRAERTGRIRAENDLKEARQARLQKQDTDNSSSNDESVARCFHLQPIGKIHSCFAQRNGTPRQPLLVPHALSRFEIRPGLSIDALDGINEYSHCWVIYIFHKNTDLHQHAFDPLSSQTPHNQGLKTKISVPRLNGKKMGVLATRSPHRPCPIGLSVAKIVGFRGKDLVLSGLDVVDGSPVLDIKPYVPFCDCISIACAPTWVARACPEGDDPLQVDSVCMSDSVVSRINECWETNKGRSLYRSGGEFVQLVKEVLSRDIRSVHQRFRQRDVVHDEYHAVLECVDIEYHIEDGKVLVCGASNVEV